MLPKTLIIAGFDPTSGAGLTADLKTIYSLNVYSCSAITSVTIQNTQKIKKRYDIDPYIVSKQLKIIFEDIEINSIKIGMLPTKKHIEVVYNILKSKKTPIILDPVFESSTGYKLVDSEVREEIKKIIKISKVVTPNIKEAEIISDIKIQNKEDMKKAAKEMLKLGCKSVLIKGGDLNSSKSIDILYTDHKFYEFLKDKINKKIHGTGCHLSSAIAAYIAKGNSIQKSVSMAKKYTYDAILNSKDITKGKLQLIHNTEDRKICKKIENWAYEFRDLENSYKLIPEVGINIAYIPEDSNNLEEIIGLTGRIIKDKNKPEVVGYPERGGSKHIATVAYTAHKFDPKIKCSMNIKMSDKILNICKSLKFKIGEFDRLQEPKNVSSMEWGTEKVMRESKKTPDIIFDRGAVGKESMIRLFGRDINDISNKVKLIISKMK